MCRWKWLITLARINEHQVNMFNCSQTPKWSNWWRGTGHLWEISDLKPHVNWDALLRKFDMSDHTCGCFSSGDPYDKTHCYLSLPDWRETYLQMDSSIPKVPPFTSYKTTWSPCHIHFFKEQFYFWRANSSFFYFHISINFDHIMWLL